MGLINNIGAGSCICDGMSLNQILQTARESFRGENDVESLDNFIRANVEAAEENPEKLIYKSNILKASELRETLYAMEIEEVLQLNKFTRLHLCIRS